MTTSLLRQLPGLIDEGRAIAEEARLASVHLEGYDSAKQLITADNLATLLRLNPGIARLVYLDPPFDSRANYRNRIQTRSATGELLVLDQFAYQDFWDDGTAEYLRMLIPRLVVATELLADDGAICVHLDWHASHLVRLVLDELLGRDNFVNELVWSYRSGGASRTASVPRKHDNLLLYRRSPAFRIQPLFERQYLDKPFIGTKQDAEGRHYVDTILRDVLEGSINLVEPGDDPASASVQAVSVRPVLNVSAERTGYATQKPEGLLELLLRWTTCPGDLVIDPFSGSGTTAVVAERLGRRWIAVDASERASVVARTRLNALGARYQHTSTARVSDGKLHIEVDAGQGIVRLVNFQSPTDLAVRLSGDLSTAIAGDGLGALSGWRASVAGQTISNWRSASGSLKIEAQFDEPFPPDTIITVEGFDLAGRATEAQRFPI